MHTAAGDLPARSEGFTMSYAVTIEGEVQTNEPAAAEAEETAIINALRSTIAGLGPDAGLTSAEAVFDISGTVDLLPEPTPADKLRLALGELDDVAARVETDDPADADALRKAVTDVRNAVAAVNAPPAVTLDPATANTIPEGLTDTDAAAHAEQAAAATAPPAL